MPYLRDINPENIRIWAYDSELYFLEQDEDLMLHRPEFVPALIEMAARDDCPKQQYIKSILEYFIQCSFLYKNDIQLSEIEAAIKESRPFLKTQWLIMWAINFQYIYRVNTNPTILTEVACEKIAKDLTVGDYCKREFTKLEKLKDGAYAFLANTASFHLYFYINPLNGKWKISKQGPLLQFD